MVAQPLSPATRIPYRLLTNEAAMQSRRTRESSLGTKEGHAAPYGALRIEKRFRHGNQCARRRHRFTRRHGRSRYRRIRHERVRIRHPRREI